MNRDKIKDNILKNIKYIPFLIFFIMMLKQFLNVFVYFDDYGFASLSYSKTIEGVEGLNYNLLQLIKFLYMYYMNWGGRVISFGVEALLLKNGVIIMQIAMAIAVSLIFYFSYKIISIKSKKIGLFSAILICSLYGLIHIGMLRDSFYWYTSAAIYVLPFVPYFIGVYFWTSNSNDNGKIKNDKFEILKRTLITVVIFIASFSQEQVSISLSVLIGVYIVINYIFYKRIKRYDIINLISSILGTIFVMFAPGNQGRMGENPLFYATPLVTRTIGNINAIYDEVFGYKFIYIMNVYIFSLILLGIIMFIKNYKYKFIHLVFSITNLIILSLIIIKKVPLYDLLSNKLSTNLILGLITLYIIFLCIEIIFYYIKENKFIILSIFVASLCTIGSMAFIPCITIRCYVPFVILSFLIITDIITDFLEEVKMTKEIKGKKLELLFELIILICIVPISFKNYKVILEGYEANIEYHVENDRKLKELSDKLKNGEKISEITLSKLPNEICANQMPYQEGFSYIEEWMKEYYNIDSDVEFKWK